MKYKAQFNWKKRTIGTVSTLVLTYGFIILTSQPFFATNMGMYVKLFQPVVMQKQDGGVLAFIYETQFMKVKTPDGYDKTAAETALLDYEDKEDTTSAAKTTEDKKLPNIIVIMDETFSDLRVLGDFSTTRPVTPYIDSILASTDNTISGKVNVSVLGGNTPNSEYEFLTSNSMAFLPQGSIPYQQYITGKTPSLVSYLDDMGYKTVAIHPFNAPGWDRDRVYPLLSFDEMYFINDFILPEKIRKYVSDAESFRKVEKMYETKEEGEPLFVFNVTMQNHSSFNVKYDGYNPDISVLGTKSYQLSNYLTLTNYTDNAVKDLIDYFSKVDEDTIIVFFGDHQPNDDVGKPILKKLGKDPDNLSVEDNANRYITPFFIWANYDIEGTTGVKEESGLDSSLNYLAPRALQAAGLPLTDYMKYVQTVEKEYPVISAIQVKDKDGNSYSVDDKLSDLNEYAKLAYYRLFDTQVKVTKEEETTAEQSTVDANANK